MINLGFIQIDSSNLIVILFGIAVFAIQLVLCLKVRLIIVKLIPIMVAVVAGIVFFIGMCLSNGWDVLGYFALLIYAFIALGVCAIAFIVYGIICLIKKIKNSK